MNNERLTRQDGKEGDRFYKTHKRLLYKWQTSDPNSYSSCQVSKSSVRDWVLEAVRWYDGYEAVINYIGEQIESKKIFKTRLDAQVGAEELLHTWIQEQYRKICG